MKSLRNIFNAVQQGDVEYGAAPAHALFAVMEIFFQYQINLIKLELRPVPAKPWEYMFYANLEADIRHGCFGLKGLQQWWHR